MSDRARTEAYVTLATNDQYAHGALALGKSLRNTGTQRRLCLLIAEQVTQEMRARLQHLWDEILIVNEMISGDREHLELLRRPELEVTFSKLHIWRLIQFQKGVFLDADTLVLSNVDALFEYEELSAAPDVGWPDIFNSGVFVFKPSLATFQKLVAIAKSEGSFDGGDQGLLNSYWSDWSRQGNSHRLPFSYNVVANLTYTYAPALRRFRRDIKIVHFLGPIKPWHHRYDTAQDRIILMSSDQSQLGSVEFLISWWKVYSSTLPHFQPVQPQPHPPQLPDTSYQPVQSQPPQLPDTSYQPVQSQPPQPPDTSYQPVQPQPHPPQPPDSSYQPFQRTQPDAGAQPDTSTYPAQPDAGSMSAQPDAGSQSAQPDVNSQQDTSTHPAQPDTSIHPAQPDTSTHPAQPDTSIHPAQPDPSTHTAQPDTNIHPTLPDTSTPPAQPDTSAQLLQSASGTIDLMASGSSQPVPSDESQRQAWERSEPDYLGIHQSDNIMKYITKQLEDL